MSKKERKIFEKLPFEVIDTDNEDMHKDGKNNVQVGPKKYIQPGVYKDCGLDIYNFEARPDDVYLLGYPRSGTTVHSEMVWLIGNDLNYEGAAKDFLDYRFPHIDFGILLHPESVKRKVASMREVSDDVREIANKYGELTLKGLASRKYRRFIKSHLPLSLMPPSIFEVGAKVIYCARNPRDVLVSMYNAMFFFRKGEEQTNYSFKRYFDEVKNNEFFGCPILESMKEAWARKDDPNFLFLFYEDTLKDKRGTILRVANFLGKKLTDDQLVKLEDHLSFDKFKNNKSVNLDQLIKVGVVGSENQEFIRKGKTGSWRDYFEGDMEKEVDEWLKTNLAGTGLRFP